MLVGWRARVAVLKREVTAIAYAARDPRTSWAVRLLVLAIVAYTVSPIDLIPDFIPVLGLLDELLLLPAALMLARRLIPEAALAEARAPKAPRPRALLPPPPSSSPSGSRWRPVQRCGCGLASP